MPTLPRPRLGELLVRAGAVTPEQADAAAAVHRANERTIGQQLLADGAVTELDLAAALSYQLDTPLVLLDRFPIDDVAVHLTPPDLIRARRLLVVGTREDEILVAMAEPTDLAAREALAARTGRRVVPLLAVASDLEREIERRLLPTDGAEGPAVAADREGPPPRPEASARRPEQPGPEAPAPPAPSRPAAGELVPFPRAGPRPVTGEAPPGEPPAAPERAPTAGEQPPARASPPEPPPAVEAEVDETAQPAPERPARVLGLPRARAEGPESQIVRFLLAQAIREQASDIHVEPLADRLQVRFRIEGALREVTQLPRDMSAAIAARVRSLAGMAPGDRQGRLLVRDEARDATFDVSTVSTLWGEKIVLRVIERTSAAPVLDDLGMEAGTLERWRELLRSPYGLLLVAGMPGMGKTTTLYASLRELPSATKDVTTVEDPVAYALEGVNQVQVDRANGGSLGSTLRAVLAQEPDVVLVSDLRDRDTADVAMNAALAGRLVLSSIQASDAVAALYRVVGLGVDPYLASASVVAVLAQLLIPRLCEHCRAPAQPAMIEAALLRQAGLPAERVFVARGCARCNGTGHRGRAAAFELLVPTEELRTAVERGAKIEEAREIAGRAGLVTLREAGLRLVSEGAAAMPDLMTRLPASGT